MRDAQAPFFAAPDLLRELLAGSAEAAAILDRDHRIVEVNGAYARFLGIPRERLVGRDARELFDQDLRGAFADPDSFVDNLLLSYADGRLPNGVEVRLRGDDSRRERWVELRSRPIGDASAPDGRIDFFADITRRRHAEDAMRNMALGVSADTGEAFFCSLVTYLSRSLEMDFAFVGEHLSAEITDSGERSIRTLAFCERGELKTNFIYALSGTPCEQNVSGRACNYPSGVARSFPGDGFLGKERIESYIAVPLTNALGEPLGQITVLGRRPLDSTAPVEAAIRVFAGRTAAELERLRVERGLREKESGYRAMFETNRAVKLLIDPRTGAVVDCNAAACELYGYGRQVLRGLPIEQIDIGPEGLASEVGVAGFLDDGATTTERRTFLQSIHRLASGEERHMDIYTGPLIRDGRRLLLAIIHDVTERGRAEEALRHSETRYRRLFEQSKDVVYISAPDGRLIDLNQAGLDLLGYPSKQEALKINLTDTYIDPLQRRALMQEVARQGFAKDFELQLQTRLGEPKIVQGTASAVHDEGGEMVAVLGMLRDVTEQRQLEEQLRQSQKMEAIGRLAGGLAHDFNNLLTAINGYAQLLSRLNQDEIQNSYIDEILQAGRRASELTGKLLTLSRRQVTNPRILDLNQLIDGLSKLLQQLIGEDIELVSDFAADLGKVRADESQLEQVLLNMAVNARDAMPTGGRLVFSSSNVELPHSGTRPAAHGRQDSTAGELQRDIHTGSYVRLAITDTGVGIAEDVLPHIFEPFFTTKSNEKGTGLGLSTAYATVNQNGGFLEVESSPGMGTGFLIYLPRVDSEGAAEGRSLEGAELPRGGEGVILLVEDNDAVRTLVRELLEQQGYKVLEAAHADQAMERVEQHGDEIDLLVSDVVMPGMSGPELAALLAERMPELKILFMTGYAGSFISRHGLSDAHTVLQKPLDIHFLAQKVRQILDTSKDRP